MKRWRRACGAIVLGFLAALPARAQEPAPPDEEPRSRGQHHAPSGASALAPLPAPLNLAATPGGGSVTVYEAEEVLALQASEEEARRADILMRVAGGRLIRRRQLSSLGLILSTYRIATGARLPEQLQSLLEQTPELLADLNHRYHLAGEETNGDPRTQAFFARRIGWSPALAACARNRAVGLLDTPIARTHPALKAARIRTFSALPAGVDEAAPDHGTAIATLLVGNPAAPRHQGLIPDARLFAATVFRNDGDQPRTNAEWLAVGLDWLVSQDVRVVNLSVGGPSNRVLARAVEESLARGIVLVAAAGNDGPAAPPQYPAAWSPVIAVTAIDANDAPYEDANRGPHVDLAAPGVDVWAGTADAGRFYTGTSFAAPFVTAAIAALGADAESKLVASATDLGAPGRDPVFGHGRMRLETLTCASP